MKRIGAAPAEGAQTAPTYHPLMDYESLEKVDKPFEPIVRGNAQMRTHEQTYSCRHTHDM